ncbi:hypothetical protein [Pelodictyon luteolum]|uniref:Uncharacterized protein n=1 Tax=Chlorobium luteolum (strain DSM 273 / BCRC 81028 / 2530) TaxID=319225 RepID=Q3B2V7_CHLL3|nr:hypothetical protein [Pelodictyon luteolum]ABB24324.1 conserved hypothetical protein [Pelodictyon luteolum DSM 273]
MGKRQIIYRPDRIANNQELVNREVNLVTREARVWHGILTLVGASEVELKDARSGRHRFSITEIEKIYSDIKTEY